MTFDRLPHPIRPHQQRHQQRHDHRRHHHRRLDRGQRLDGGRRASTVAVALAASGLLLAACSSHHRSTSPTTAPATIPSPTSATTTSVPPTTVAAPSTTTASAGSAGTYSGATAADGEFSLDGATGFFQAPDTTACPKCSAATVPVATLTFSVADTPGASSLLELTGKITGTSDPTWAAKLPGHPVVGAAIRIGSDAQGALFPSFAPGSFTRTSEGAVDRKSPCTVAAVSAPVAAANGGQQESVDSVTCSTDGEWAAASAVIHGKAGGFAQNVLLAGTGSSWVAVNQATVCADHDVTPAFSPKACGAA